MLIELGKTDVLELGLWLDSNMPNPPLPDPQRWNVINTAAYISVNFATYEDAVWFKLMWG